MGGDSGTIDDERIKTVLGKNVSLWKVTIREPNNNFLQSRKQLQDFRVFARKLMNNIKSVHGQDAILHIFSAIPVAIAVELGRIQVNGMVAVPIDNN